MSTKSTRHSLFAASFLLIASGVPAAFAAPLGLAGAAIQTTPMAITVQDCFIDDGYGRRTSCDSPFKQRETVNRPTYEECTIDDGYGRKVSCSAFIKEPHPAETK